MTDHNIPTESKARQCAAILNRLRIQRAITTLECREDLGICHPAGRIAEIRRAGVEIHTTMAWVEDAEGRRHRCAVYSLGGARHG